MLIRFSYILLFVLLACSCKNREQLSICFTGDLLLDRGVRQQIERKGSRSLFEHVSPVFELYDAVVVNLECPVTEKVSPLHKKYIFKADPEWVQALSDAGISHATMANNHTNDQGRDAMDETFQYLGKHHIRGIGYGINQNEACSPTLIRKHGMSVAIFNSVTIPLENWVYLSASPGICQAKPHEMIARIKAYKEDHPAHFIVVVLHWGVEFAEHPTDEQRYQARSIVDSGADAVIGHHPHVVQDLERYKGKPILYSLGNFVFDQHYPSARKGIMAGLTFYHDSVFVHIHPFDIIDCTPVPKYR